MQFDRQIDIFNPAQFIWPVQFIGMGGIGSAASVALKKLGVRELILYDDDTIEPHNLPNQILYEEEDLVREDRRKVAIAATRLASKGCRVAAHGRRWTPEEELDGLVVCGVDSIEVRREIWGAVGWNPMVPLYLDGRLGGEMLQLYTIRPTVPDDVEFYEQFLFPNTAARRLPCTAQSIVYPAMILAGLIAAQVTRWVRQEPFPRRILMDCRTLLFETTE